MAVNYFNPRNGSPITMSNKKPDIFWILAFVVALGAASSSLLSDESPRMAPQQAGILIQ